MRRILPVFLLPLALAAVSNAAPMCAAGSLADYFSLDPDGCEIGVTQFRDFAPLPLAFEATEISPGSIQVVPIATQYKPGFQFVLNAAAGRGALLESIFQFSVFAPQLTGNTLRWTAVRLPGTAPFR